MMTFYNIMDIDHFFRKIDACTGRISIKTNEALYTDIRRNRLVQNLLKMACSGRGIERLDICVENVNDRAKLLQYMMECNCSCSLSLQ